MDVILNGYFLENRLLNIIGFGLILFFGLLLRGLIAKVISGIGWKILHGKGEISTRAEFNVIVRRPMVVLVSIIIYYSAFSLLHFPPSWQISSSHEFGVRMFINRTFAIASIVAITMVVMRIVDFFGAVYYYKFVEADNRLGQQLFPFTRELLKILIVIFAFFFTLGSVFGLNIANIIAGLGIGGLAVALAAKETLENLFASFTIFLDSPFVVGDFVQAGNIKGTIEKVGFRSTRIRTLEKSVVTLPNKMLVDQAVDNLQERNYMRVKFNFNLPFGTTKDVIVAITDQINSLLITHPRTNHSEAYVGFHEFDENAIRITVIYYIDSIDVNESNLVKQEVNLSVLEIVGNAGIKFHSNILGIAPI